MDHKPKPVFTEERLEDQIDWPKVSPASRLTCQACSSDADTCLLDAPDGLTLRHCMTCRLTSVVNPVTTAAYDAEYVAERYDRYPTTERMSRLRVSFVETVLKLYDALPAGCVGIFADNRKILDVGYGNGAFLRRAIQNGWNASGYDVNPTEYPGVRRVAPPSTWPDPRQYPAKERFRAITFFDSLEHFETLDEIRGVSAHADWIFVTAPLPPPGFPQSYGAPMSPGGEVLTIGKLTPLLQPWKHWRPGEHHHFFHPKTLEHLFTWKDEVADIQTVATLMHVSHFEDSIRGTGPEGRPNTFSAALRCTTMKE